MEIWGSSDLELCISEAAFMLTAGSLGGRGGIPLLRIVFTPGPDGTDTVLGHLVMGKASCSLTAEVVRVAKQVSDVGQVRLS